MTRTRESDVLLTRRDDLEISSRSIGMIHAGDGYCYWAFVFLRNSHAAYSVRYVERYSWRFTLQAVIIEMAIKQHLNYILLLCAPVRGYEFRFKTQGRHDLLFGRNSPSGKRTVYLQAGAAQWLLYSLFRVQTVCPSRLQQPVDSYKG